MEKAELEEGQINDSNTPVEKEISILTGQVKRPEPFIQFDPNSKQKTEDYLQNQM